MTLVSTDWLNENSNRVKIIDASWHLVKNRNAVEEYNKELQIIRREIEDLKRLIIKQSR